MDSAKELLEIGHAEGVAMPAYIQTYAQTHTRMPYFPRRSDLTNVFIAAAEAGLSAASGEPLTTLTSTVTPLVTTTATSTGVEFTREAYDECVALLDALSKRKLSLPCPACGKRGGQHADCPAENLRNLLIPRDPERVLPSEEI